MLINSIALPSPSDATSGREEDFRKVSQRFRNDSCGKTDFCSMKQWLRIRSEHDKKQTDDIHRKDFLDSQQKIPTQGQAEKVRKDVDKSRNSVLAHFVTNNNYVFFQNMDQGRPRPAFLPRTRAGGSNISRRN